MLTNKEAQEQYEKARAALDEIANSLDASEVQMKEAIAARDKLITDYININIDDVALRTQQYEKFIKDMTTLIGKMSTGNVLSGLETLQDIVDGASVVLGKPANDSGQG